MLRRQTRKLSVLFFFALAVGGCGGRKVVSTTSKELSIPPELAKAFAVKDPEKKPESRRFKTVEKKIKPGLDGAQGQFGPATKGFKIPLRRPEKDPLWVGEKIWMDVTWLGTKAGEFLLQVLPMKELDGRKVYNLRGDARTSDLFSLVYRAEDWVESFVDFEGWFPYKFVLHGDESRHIRSHLELFDHAAKKQYVHLHDNRIKSGEVVEKKGYEDLIPFSQDSLSAIYYARNFKLEDGYTMKFPMTSGGKQFDTEVTVLGREEVSTKMGYVKAIKTKVITKFQNVLQQKGDAFMWFSDDDRKYPLRFEAKVRIGWVAGIARQIEPGTPPEREAGASGSSSVKDAAPVVAASPPNGPTGERRLPKRRQWFRYLLEQEAAGHAGPGHSNGVYR